MRLSFAIQHHVTCPCGATVPVNAIVDSIPCRACAREIELPAAYWRERFERAYRPWSVRAGETEASELRAIGALDSYLRYGVEDPVCGHGACRARVEVTDTTCRTCGARVRVRPADALVKLVDPNATFVVGEDVAATELHPHHVVCEYDEAAYRAYRWHLLRERVADAERALEPPALLAQLARDNSVDVREVVAANAATPPEALAELVRDGHPRVRTAVVANHATPAEPLAVLAKDETVDEVLHALVARHVLPAIVVDALASSYRADNRGFALKCAGLSHRTLRALERDPEGRVKRAAAQRIRELEKAGTRVEGGGWWRKLLGG